MPLPSTHSADESQREGAADLLSDGSLASILDALPVYIAYVDAECRYRYTNRAYEAAFGIERDAMYGRHARDVLGEVGFAAVNPMIERALSGETVHYERRAQVEPHGERFLRGIYMPHIGRSGRVLGFFALIMDDTEGVKAQESVRRSDERFRLMSETIHDVLWDWDVASGRVWRSRSNAVFGYEGDETRSNSQWWEDGLHPDDRARVLESLDAAMHKDAVWQASYRFRNRIGRYAFVLDRAMIQRNAEGSPVRVVGAMVDVTEQKRAALLLEGQKRVLEALSEGAPLPQILELLTSTLERHSLDQMRATIMLVRDGRLWNGASTSMSQGFVDAVEGVPIGPTVGACGAAAALHQTVIIEDLATHPNGIEFRALAKEHQVHACFCEPVMNSSGEVLATFCAYLREARPPDDEELTALRLLARTASVAIERSQAEEALRRQGRITQTITDNAASCLFLLDDKGHPTYMNPAAQRVLGYTLAELAAGPLHDVLHRGSATAEPCLIVEALRGGVSLRDHEDHLVRKDGTSCPVMCHLAPLHQEGRYTGAVLEFSDMSEHHRAREVHETNRRLLDLNRLKSEFVATMSHELRTPLNSIIGFTEVLLSDMSGPVSEVQRRQLRLVADAGNDLLKLINEILELSRMEAGKATLDVARFDLTECISGCIDVLRPAVEQKGLTLIVKGVETVPPILSDARRIRQILLNLLSNAVKFTHRGSIELVATHDAERVHISVRDSGIGISEANCALLFQAFSRLGAEPTQEGAGLGLYISRKLAGMLGGTLELESAEGVGTTLILTLPLEYRK